MSDMEREVLDARDAEDRACREAQEAERRHQSAIDRHTAACRKAFPGAKDGDLVSLGGKLWRYRSTSGSMSPAEAEDWLEEARQPLRAADRIAQEEKT